MVSPPGGSVPGPTLQLALFGIDQLGALGGEILGEQAAATGSFGKFRVADVADKIGVGELFRLDHGVQRGGGVQAVLRRAEMSP